MILEYEAEVQAFRTRAEGKSSKLPSDVALRLIGKRDEVHPRDVIAFVWRDPELAEEACRGNREWFEHDVWGPIMIDGGMLEVIDFRPDLRRQGLPVTDPSLPDK